ncbi:MAG: Cobyrinic acid ac-diamide synthase [Dehalococcoidia bacterium]|nr:Cobyrinic acid ac-diamide synthase [Dehalococcoidia bacterium]
MTTTIAIGGKGGVGKTSIAALLIKLLSEKGVVLAIDGDPSSNLHLALGLPLTTAIGDIREEMSVKVKSGRFDVGISKPDYIELKIHEALVESSKIDLLAMGRPEGPGCYCAANNMLRSTIDRLGKNYDYVVVDNEAGLEHISRQTTRDVDILIIVSDPSLRGLITAARIKGLIGELRTHVGRIALVVNRLNGGLSPEGQKLVADNGMEIVGILPADPEVTELDSRGAALVELGENSTLRQGVRDIARKLNLI